MTKKHEEPGMLSRLVATGLGALFLTEEGIRKGVRQGSVPREAAKFLLGQVERRKDEMMQLVREELHQALAKIPFERIVKEILKENDLAFTVRFTPRSSHPLHHARKVGHRSKSKS